jgi:DNA-binding NarL/FixJ family response regulator
MAVTVTIVDDHPAILAGVRAWFAAADPPITVLADGATVDVAWTEPGNGADVVVLDLNIGGAAPLRRLVDVGRKVVVYTMREEEEVALSCIDIGAAAFLTKAEGQAHLVSATMAAADSRPYLPPTLAGAIASDRRRDRPHLSDREQEVLRLWFQCDSKDLVARGLGITVRTVGTYLDRVRIKYANAGRPAPTKAALLARAIQDGLVDVDEL